MSNLRLQLAMVVATMLLFSATLALNTWLFSALEFARGINWIYLPAGMRLLCTLLFAEAGAIGLLIISWLVCFYVFFPDDYVRAFMGGILASAAPYLAYRISRSVFGLKSSLANLTTPRLLACVLGYSIASPLLHHIWFAAQGATDGILHSFFAMVMGDLAGTLIVIYAAKAMLAFIPRSTPSSRS